ncbi:hypothetical protein OAJ27_00130 [bacterium]|nr:hypothetical protein [bacterium]
MVSVMLSRGNLLLDLVVSLGLLAIIVPTYLYFFITLSHVQSQQQHIDNTLTELHRSINQPHYSSPSLRLLSKHIGTIHLIEFNDFSVPIRWAN